MNPMKFVTLLRIERAKELLKRNDFTVSLVANEVGFKDLSNFIRQFKKNTGVTPTMYRKQRPECKTLCVNVHAGRRVCQLPQPQKPFLQSDPAGDAS